MITDERHHGIAKAEARKFEQAIAAARATEPNTDVHPRIQRAMIESLESELAVLREDIERYEALKSGEVRQRKVMSLSDLGTPRSG